jgi:hypothetical protein
MRIKSSKGKKSIAVLLIAIIFISVGYAFLQSNLLINGNAKVKVPTWHIYFTNVQVTSGSVTPIIEPTTSGKTTTTLTWEVNMDTPGQFYEFTVDIVNDGTIDAMMNSVPGNVMALTDEQKKYVDYSIKYSDGSEIGQYDKLAAGDTETIRVRVEYKTNIAPEDLPAPEQDLTLHYTADFVQADNRAQTRILPVFYAVQIYGINQDVDADGNTLGLTFGPATGEDLNNAYITHTYKSNGDGTYNLVRVKHNIIDKYTTTTTEQELNVIRTEEEKNKYDVNIRNMSWAKIAEQSQNDPTVFTDCVLCGDTKRVEIYLNETIREQQAFATGSTMATSTATSMSRRIAGDGAGMLRTSIPNYYRLWNTARTNEGGYSASHIRATLIGQNTKTLTFSSSAPAYIEPIHNNPHLSEYLCVYSCMEDSLKNVITAKKIKYRIGDVVKSDIADKIWLFSYSELNNDPSHLVASEGSLYEKFANPNSVYYNDIYAYRCYNESGFYSRAYLRGCDFEKMDDFVVIDEINSMEEPRWGYGWDYGPACDSADPIMGQGLAFGFCIK